MKKLLIGMIAFLCVLLLGCSENKPPRGDFDYMSSSPSENSSQNYLNSELSETNSELTSQQVKDLVDKLPFSYASAWAKAAFGDDTLCAELDSENFQCIVSTKYDSTSDGVKSMMKDIMNSATTLGAVQSSITYQNIFIKLLDMSEKEAIEVTMKKDGDSYSLYAITGDLEKSVDLAKGINEYSSEK